MSKARELKMLVSLRMFRYKGEFELCIVHLSVWHCSALLLRLRLDANPFECPDSHRGSTGITLLTPLVRVGPTTNATYRFVTSSAFVAASLERIGSPKFRHKQLIHPLRSETPARQHTLTKASVSLLTSGK